MKKRQKRYRAVCQSLDVATQGPAKKKALDNLRDAIWGFLADRFERGTLDEVLQQAGFLSARKPTGRFQYPTRANWLSLPVALLAREHQSA